jgi:hypothetical protein
MNFFYLQKKANAEEGPVKKKKLKLTAENEDHNRKSKDFRDDMQSLLHQTKDDQHSPALSCPRYAEWTANFARQSSHGYTKQARRIC